MFDYDTLRGKQKQNKKVITPPKKYFVKDIFICRAKPTAYLLVNIFLHFFLLFQHSSTLQIFIVILLCKSIKVMGKMYKLMIGKILCKNYP